MYLYKSTIQRTTYSHESDRLVLVLYVVRTGIFDAALLEYQVHHIARGTGGRKRQGKGCDTRIPAGLKHAPEPGEKTLRLATSIRSLPFRFRAGFAHSLSEPLAAGGPKGLITDRRCKA